MFLDIYYTIENTLNQLTSAVVNITPSGLWKRSAPQDVALDISSSLFGGGTSIASRGLDNLMKSLTDKIAPLSAVPDPKPLFPGTAADIWFEEAVSRAGPFSKEARDAITALTGIMVLKKLADKQEVVPPSSFPRAAKHFSTAKGK